MKMESRVPSFNPQVSLACVKDGFTQSELSLKDECALKWNFRYNNLLQRRDVMDWPLFVGGAWHNFQERWRKTKGNLDLTKMTPQDIPANILKDSEFEKWNEYWMQVLPAYQQAYAQIYKEESSMDWLIIEQELSADIHGYKIRGKIDLASVKPKFIRDFKSTAAAWLTSPQGWHFKLQFMTYCWLISKNFKDWENTQFAFQLDMMQKPALKETKADGTWAGHIRRVVADVKARAAEYYLSRQQIIVLPEAIRHFEKTVLGPKIELLHLAIENGDAAISIVTNPNTNACNAYGKQCEFFEICEKGWDVGKHFFTNRPIKHQEL